MTPSQRAKKHLEKKGWRIAITEKWNSFAKVRQDLFNFGDLLGMDRVNGDIVMIQATSASNHAARRNKICGLDSAKDWIICGGLILLISFKKGKNGRYEAREEYIKV